MTSTWFRVPIRYNTQGQEPKGTNAFINPATSTRFGVFMLVIHPSLGSVCLKVLILKGEIPLLGDTVRVPLNFKL